MRKFVAIAIDDTGMMWADVADIADHARHGVEDIIDTVEPDNKVVDGIVIEVEIPDDFGSVQNPWRN